MKYPLFSENERPSLSEDRLNKHINFLKKNFYKVDRKWPQFKILFDVIDRISRTLDKSSNVLVLERSYFYGGYTLFAPLFHHANVQALDCVVNDTGDRWGKQASWLEHEECIKWRPNYRSPISKMTDIADASLDLVLVPNVVHHEKYQDDMFGEIARVLKEGGKCVIFEGLVRELHHMPDDYVRYTPEGIKVMFQKHGIEYKGCEYGTGVFDVIAYVWQNALEYFPEEIRIEKEKWFFEEHYPYLQKLDNKYRDNIKNPDKAFPMSYVITGIKSK